MKTTQKRDRQKERKLIGRVVRIVVCVLLALALITGALWLVNHFLSGGSRKPGALPSDVFYEADYDRNIFEYPAYQRLNRSVNYLEYGSGEPLTEENYESLGVASTFFYEFFDAIIRGDCETYRSFLTPYYIKEFDPPEIFTMQMLYDIEVNRTQQASTATFEGKTATVHYFSVKYKIFENNGTFRNDVASNRSTTQYYELYDVDGRFYLNATSNMKVIR